MFPITSSQISKFNSIIAVVADAGITITRFVENFSYTTAVLFLPLPNCKSIALLDENTIAYTCYASKTTSPCVVTISNFEWVPPSPKPRAELSKITIETETQEIEFNEEVLWVKSKENLLSVITLTNLHFFVNTNKEIQHTYHLEITNPSVVNIGTVHGHVYFSTQKHSTIDFLNNENKVLASTFDLKQYTPHYVKFSTDGSALIGLGRTACFHNFLTKSKKPILFDLEEVYHECLFVEVSGDYVVIGMKNGNNGKVMVFDKTKTSKTIFPF